jgi:hypothetical protein
MEGKELGVAVQNGDEQLRLDDGGTWVDLHNGGLHEEAGAVQHLAPKQHLATLLLDLSQPISVPATNNNEGGGEMGRGGKVSGVRRRRVQGNTQRRNRTATMCVCNEGGKAVGDRDHSERLATKHTRVEEEQGGGARGTHSLMAPVVCRGPSKVPNRSTHTHTTSTCAHAPQPFPTITGHEQTQAGRAHAPVVRGFPGRMVRYAASMRPTTLSYTDSWMSCTQLGDQSRGKQTHTPRDCGEGGGRQYTLGAREATYRELTSEAHHTPARGCRSPRTSRRRLVHRWPQVPTAPNTLARTARSRSASGMTERTHGKSAQSTHTHRKSTKNNKRGGMPPNTQGREGQWRTANKR